MHVVGIAEP